MSEPFRVWAPHVRELAIVTGTDVKSARTESGGFFSTAPLHPDNPDYYLRIDGRERPDPRSRSQPQGVTGPSRWLDESGAAFEWQDQHFRALPLSAAVLYELHVGTFTSEGTFAAASERLPHLVELGVTHVELMPLHTFPGDFGWGYDGVLLFAPYARYGTPEDLKRFVASCHAHGIAVIQDVVYNHLGPSGNYLSEFGPYFTERYKTPWGAAVNLDGPHSDEVRRFFIDNACMWLTDYHMDGLRLDAVHALHDESALHFLQELTQAVHGLIPEVGRPLVVIAESDSNDPRLVRPTQAGGYGLDAQWSDDFHHALHSVLTGEANGYYADFGQLAHIARALTDGWVYSGQHSSFRQRRHGLSLGDTSSHKLISYLQNHDQVGNRARGERIGHLVSEGLARIGAALLFTSPFVPQLFQGEEWGASSPFLYFADHREPDLADAVRRGRQEEFRAFGFQQHEIPDPCAEHTYRKSQLDWSELERSTHRERWEFYRALVALRRSSPDLLDGRRDRVRVEFDEDAKWLRLVRGAITLLANLGPTTQTLPRPEGELVLSYPPLAATPGADTLQVPAESVYVFSFRKIR